MSKVSKQMSTEAYREYKAGVLFDFMNTNNDGKLELRDVLEFPRRLEQEGKTDVAVKVKSLYTKYWTVTNEILGRNCELQSFGKEEFAKAFNIIKDYDWYRNTYVVGLAEAYFESIDLNHDGYISLDEWRQYKNKRGLTDEAAVKATFARLDTDGDGKISPDEFKHPYIMFGLSDDPADDYSFIYSSSVQ